MTIKDIIDNKLNINSIFNKYYEGFVIGYDKNNRQRVKVSIINLTDKIKIDDLPFYCVVYNKFNPNVNTNIPKIGERVIVKLYDIYNGIIIGQINNTFSYE